MTPDDIINGNKEEIVQEIRGVYKDFDDGLPLEDAVQDNKDMSLFVLRQNNISVALCSLENCVINS